tara:strand:- start:641 stop:1759 length:1119 start_codon:yes stop_codon:yes gene_type:complete
MKILTVIGTRPEAIKMAPLIKILNESKLNHKLCITGQHREMLDQVLSVFGINADYDLDVMRKGQNPEEVFATILNKMSQIYSKFKPDLVLVHGDTVSTSSAAMSAYFNQIKIGHIEAGLRTGNIYAPWPEEINRKVTATMTDLHFCPTKKAKENLIKENVAPEKIYVTGNTVIDALFLMLETIDKNQLLKNQIKQKLNFLKNEKIILVTGHRRESFGDGLKNICNALLKIAKNNPLVEIVYPVHPNPNVQNPIQDLLSDQGNIHLIEPLDYPTFVYLMKQSYLIITDSGGVQEEAPSLKKPVLVTRKITERPEAIKENAVLLVGTDENKIIDECNSILNDTKKYESMITPINPYGDGTAANQIYKVIKNYEP